MKKCPLFGRCGGCKYDFSSPDYHAQKMRLLDKIPVSENPIWIAPGERRRADFCFSGNQFGFFESHTKNIVLVTECPNLLPAINSILPTISHLPWVGTGSCLITVCDNGLDINITSDVPFYTPEFAMAVQKLPVLCVTWNGRNILRHETPTVTFDGHITEYPSGAFLQPSITGADILRQMVLDATVGAKRIADLFCGLGNFTFSLNADGFDIIGTGTKRDLFKNPLTVGALKKYDCVVMDPPRAGALAQSVQLAQSCIGTIVYISCNPQTWQRDAEVLRHGGYELTKLTPVDQFAGSTHWELFSVFHK